MYLLHASDSESFFHYRFDRTMQVSAFFFRLTGTNDTADDVDLGDVGRIRYAKRGKTLIDASFEALSAFASIVAGTSEYESATTGAFNMSILIPRFWLDDNVELITPEDNATFEISFGSQYQSDVASGHLAELYALEESGIQSYELKILESNDSLSSSGTYSLNSPPGTMENIVWLGVSDTNPGGTPGVMTLASSNVDRINGHVGDARFEMSTAAGLALTRTKNELPSDVGDQGLTSAADWEFMVEVFAAEIGDLTSRLADTGVLQVTTSGAADPVALWVGMEFNPNKLADTAMRAEARFKAALDRKAVAGKTRSVQTLKQVARA